MGQQQQKKVSKICWGVCVFFFFLLSHSFHTTHHISILIPNYIKFLICLCQIHLSEAAGYKLLALSLPLALALTQTAHENGLVSYANGITTSRKLQTMDKDEHKKKQTYNKTAPPNECAFIISTNRFACKIHGIRIVNVQATSSFACKCTGNQNSKENRRIKNKPERNQIDCQRLQSEFRMKSDPISV